MCSSRFYEMVLLSFYGHLPSWAILEVLPYGLFQEYTDYVYSWKVLLSVIWPQMNLDYVIWWDFISPFGILYYCCLKNNFFIAVAFYSSKSHTCFCCVHIWTFFPIFGKFWMFRCGCHIWDIYTVLCGIWFNISLNSKPSNWQARTVKLHLIVIAARLKNWLLDTSTYNIYKCL